MDLARGGRVLAGLAQVRGSASTEPSWAFLSAHCLRPPRTSWLEPCAQRCCTGLATTELQETAITQKLGSKGLGARSLHVAPVSKWNQTQHKGFFFFQCKPYFITQIPFYISQESLMGFASDSPSSPSNSLQLLRPMPFSAFSTLP